MIKASKENRLYGLDFIRALAFVEVFSCHILWGSGVCGVSVFFVLSGFLSAYTNVGLGTKNVHIPTVRESLLYAMRRVVTYFQFILQ